MSTLSPSPSPSPDGPVVVGEPAWPPEKEEAHVALKTLDHALATLHGAPALPSDLALTLQKALDAAAHLRHLLGLVPPSRGRILLADETAHRASEWTAALQQAGFSVASADSAEAARLQVQECAPHLILLSLGLVQQDGALFAALRRATESAIVVLMGRANLRTATSHIQDADDYVSDLVPLDLAVERAQALLQRPPADETRLVVGPLRIDLTTRSVSIDDKPVHLTPIEYNLLYHLASQPGKILTHEQLLQRVWGPAYTDSSDYIWVHLSRLRRKLALPGRPSLIITERGVGYRLRPVGHQPAP
ncbi:MAG: response regulator transcription factor [Anaerolineae bacterium]|nr:response regulator transcription factor [Anaerolineae bacterium]